MTGTSSSVDDQQQQYWAQEPTQTAETVPTTWSESAADGASSAASSSHSAARSFYGQRLSGKEKKLYDDTGATWNDSRSDATTSTAAQTRTSSAHASLSKASSTTRSHRMSSESASSQKKQAAVTKETPSVQLAESNSIAASSLYDQHPKDAAAIQHDDTMRTELESDESLAPMDSRSESIGEMEPHHQPPPRQQDEDATPQPKTKKSFREKIRMKAMKHDHFRSGATALVKNLVGGSARKQKTAKSPKASSVERKTVEEAASDVSARSNQQGSRRGILARAMGSPRSSVSGSSITQKEKER